MKKIVLSSVALLLAATMFVSCNKNSSKDVANTWLVSFYHLDYDAAKKVSTEDTKNLLTQVQQLSAMIADSTKKAYKNTSITVKDVKEQGDKATATYTVSDNPTLEQKLKLVKVDGKWLVQFTKDDQMEGNAAPADGSAPTDTTGAPVDATTPAPTDGNMPDSTKH